VPVIGMALTICTSMVFPAFQRTKMKVWPLGYPGPPSGHLYAHVRLPPGPLRWQHRDPAVAPLPYRIVPSHQSATQVWFDCISHFHSSPHVTFRGAHTSSPPFLLEAGQRSQRSWKTGDASASNPSLQQGLMRCLSTLTRACISPARLHRPGRSFPVEMASC
jgi:hypothetical protein